MYDFYFVLTDKHIKEINLLALYHRIQDCMSFTIDSSLKLLKEKGKMDNFFSNGSMVTFLPKARILEMNEGVIEKMIHEIQLHPEKYSFEEKLRTLSMKIKNFEVVDDGRNDDEDYSYWLKQISQVYFEQAELLESKKTNGKNTSFDNNRSNISSNSNKTQLSEECKSHFLQAKEYASKAVTKCRPIHAEAIEPLLMQIKCCLKLELFEEMDEKMNSILDLVKNHLGQNHPILVQIFEEIGDYFNQFKNEEAYTVNFYTQASVIAKMHLGTEHFIRLRLLKKLSSVKILLDQHLDAYYYMLEAIEILKIHKKQHSLEMSIILNDTLRLAQDVGINDQALEVGMYGQKVHLEYLFDNSERQLDQPVEFRSEVFNKILNNYYINCKWMKKLCFDRHRSFNFLREFCNNYYEVFTREIKHYKKNFMLDELSPDYENRRSFFKRMIKCFCLLSVMLLQKKEKLIVLTILDRYYFDPNRNMDERGRRSSHTSANQDVIHQCEKINNDPYCVLRAHLQFILDHRFFLLETLDKYQFKDVVHFYDIRNREVEEKLKGFRSFVIICGFNNFKSFIEEVEE